MISKGAEKGIKEVAQGQEIREEEKKEMDRRKVKKKIFYYYLYK